MIQTPPSEDAEAQQRSHLQWIFIGALFSVVSFLPMSLIGLWLGGRLARRFTSSQETALLAATAPVLLAYAIAALGAGAVIGRFGLRARSWTAPAAGALGGTLLLGTSMAKGVGPWPLLLAAALVFVVGGALWSTFGARLGRTRRP
ncbi:MAG: hypothetical protein QM756_21320 [Polyangiaceae bacterium]